MKTSRIDRICVKNDWEKYFYVKNKKYHIIIFNFPKNFQEYYDPISNLPLSTGKEAQLLNESFDIQTTEKSVNIESFLHIFTKQYFNFLKLYFEYVPESILWQTANIIEYQHNEIAKKYHDLCGTYLTVSFLVVF